MLNQRECFRAVQFPGVFHPPVTAHTSLHTHSYCPSPLLVAQCQNLIRMGPSWCWKLCNKDKHSFPVLLASLYQFISCSSMGFGLPISVVHLFGQQCACLWWWDPWHEIESPNNARGLHGQVALHSQRYLSMERAFFLKARAIHATFLPNYTCRCVSAKSKGKILKDKVFKQPMLDHTAYKPKQEEWV